MIKTEKFEDVIESPLDEWIYMIKNSEIKADFKSKNIQIAKAKLDYMKMSFAEKRQHDKYLMDLASEKDIIETAKKEGEKIGIEKGKELTIIAKNKQVVSLGHKAGLSISLLAQMTALSEKEVKEIIDRL